MPLVLQRLGAQVVVGMLGLIDGLARDPIALAGPGAEVDHLASFGAERPEPIGRRQIDRPLADRASHTGTLPKVCGRRNNGRRAFPGQPWLTEKWPGKKQSTSRTLRSP